MITKSKNTRLLSFALACAGFVLASGNLMSAQAQRDPFSQPDYKKPKPTTTVSSSGKIEKPKPPGPPPVTALAAPAIESRIAYYKNQRETAAANGSELPKVTSVLTLDELAVTGIFKTPRGYAAMVEAKPIKLSYTIYPGEKFFDGQLVAIEENRLVFRKVTKMSNNKFVSSVENKTLRQFTVEQEVNGTAPVQPAVKSEESSNAALVPKDAAPQSQPATAVAPTMVVSPLDEMNRQPKEEPAKTAKDKTGKEKPVKKGKKPVKVADNKKPDVKE